MLSSLAREAAELLWEMVATEDIGDAMQQMRENATTIQVLRDLQLQPKTPAGRVPLSAMFHGKEPRPPSSLHALVPASLDCHASCPHLQ